MPPDNPEFDRVVRTDVYRHFVEDGVAPTTTGLARSLGVDEFEVREALERLESARALTLTPITRQIWMAHPFSAVPTQYPVKTACHQYWANCAWDALALPSLLGMDARIRTDCPGCGQPLTVNVKGGSVTEPTDAVVHFVVPLARFWDDVGFT
jgi:hypothetical protein